ncbi:MAG: hypothetical protein IJV31_03565 [Clostridia bacterium]|nr:hypothetical protein [Clostridia bacterium]
MHVSLLILSLTIPASKKTSPSQKVINEMAEEKEISDVAGNGYAAELSTSFLQISVKLKVL